MLKTKTFHQLNWAQYEHFCIDYHRNTYKQITWHWTHIPETILEACGFINSYNTLRLKRKEKFIKDGTYYNPVREYGLDGIAEEIIDGVKVYHGVQCKFMNEKKQLTANELGTFGNVITCRLKIKNPQAKGYLYYSCKLQKDLSDDYKNATFFIAIPLKYNTLPPLVTESINDPYPFQSEIILKLDNGWVGRGLLISPCGTGKTYMVSKHIQNMNYKKIFIFTPLRIQVKQFIDRISPFLPNHKKLIVDSDNDATLDIKNVIEILDSECIIASTYKSAIGVISQLFTKNDVREYIPNIDLSNSLLIVDEVHNLINNTELIDIIKGFPKVLLLTATPPSQIESIVDCQVIHNYPMRDAIKDGYICDYEIYLPLVEDNDIPYEVKELDSDLCMKTLFLINGMLKTGSRHCIVYLSTIEECNNFVDVLTQVMKKYYALALWTGIITSDTIQINRENILTEFEKESDVIKIIASVRILDEAIDIIKCDSTFITNIGDATSDIKTLQRMCRANRKDKMNPNKKASCFMWASDLDKCVMAMSLLKENDIEFKIKIRYINSNYDNNNKTTTNNKIVEHTKNIIEYIDIKCLTLAELVEYNINQVLKYCDEHEKFPPAKTKLGQWLLSQIDKMTSFDNQLYNKLSKNSNAKLLLDEYLILYLHKTIQQYMKNINNKVCSVFKKIYRSEEHVLKLKAHINKKHKIDIFIDTHINYIDYKLLIANKNMTVIDKHIKLLNTLSKDNSYILQLKDIIKQLSCVDNSIIPINDLIDCVNKYLTCKDNISCLDTHMKNIEIIPN